MEPKSLLFVDGDPDMLRLWASVLGAEGYEVVACSGFDEARRHLTGRAPDAMLTDIRLGSYNGLHLVLLARAMHPTMPIWVMTGFDDVMLREETLRTGARYLLKPVRRETLLSDLKAALAQA